MKRIVQRRDRLGAPDRFIGFIRFMVVVGVAGAPPPAEPWDNT
jgi:hypothetical protein